MSAIDGQDEPIEKARERGPQDPPHPDNICSNCNWFCALDPEVSAMTVDGRLVGVNAPPGGRCRFDAPTMSGWPYMAAADWCGDFESRDKDFRAALGTLSGPEMTILKELLEELREVDEWWIKHKEGGDADDQRT
jgi:hypothetical protein